MISLPWKEVKTASLPVWPWQTSSPPLNLRKICGYVTPCQFKCIFFCHFSNKQCQQTLPSKTFKLDRLSQNRQEFFKVITLFIVTKYFLFCELEIQTVMSERGFYNVPCPFNKCLVSIWLQHTCLSFWYSTPNLKLGDILCSSNAWIRSGAWSTDNNKAELNKISH